jgi:hypothetical protein
MAGSRTDARSTAASFVGEAHFDGLIVLTGGERARIAAALPAGVELAHDPAGPPDRHTVIFAFGEQTRTAVLFGGLVIPTGVRYHEAMVAIPHVRWVDDGRPCTFIPLMCCTDPWATWSGNTYYGFAKRMATVERRGNTFLVSASEGPLLLHATVNPESGWTPACECTLRGLATVTEVFEAPVLGRRADGSFVRSRFEWSFAAASVRPATTMVAIDTPLGSGLDAAVFHGTEWGSFEVTGMRWRLSWPEPSAVGPSAPRSRGGSRSAL